MRTPKDVASVASIESMSPVIFDFLMYFPIFGHSRGGGRSEAGRENGREKTSRGGKREQWRGFSSFFCGVKN